jgi:hypothetical protein
MPENETGDAVPQEVLDTRRRTLALARLREVAADGGFDLTLLMDKGNYRRLSS